MKSKILLGFTIVSLISVIYFSFLYVQDKHYVKGYIKYLNENSIINGEMSSYEKSIGIRDFILRSINTDLRTCKFFDYSRRPLWGYRVSDILKSREGQCGEGTRLLINILSALDIPSRRVYLYNYTMNHALVEIFDGKYWILLDSINSPPNFREYTIFEKRRIEDYFNTNKRNWTVPKEKMAAFGFYNYSYFNWNKLSSNKFLKTEIYMHKPLFDNYSGLS